MNYNIGALIKDIKNQVKKLSAEDKDIKSWATRIEKGLKEIENLALRMDFDKYYWGRHKEEVGRPGFEIFVKIYINIPEKVNIVLSSFKIQEIFRDESNNLKNVIIDSLKKGYNWIKDVKIVGITGEWWIVIIPKYNYMEQYKDIRSEVSYYLRHLKDDIEKLMQAKLLEEKEEIEKWWRKGLMLEYEDFIKKNSSIIKQIYKIYLDLDKIEDEIRMRRRNFEKKLSDMEFWEQFIKEGKIS